MGRARVSYGSKVFSVKTHLFQIEKKSMDDGYRPISTRCGLCTVQILFLDNLDK